MLKVTKANVWASMAEGRSRLARVSGIRTNERASWGRKAMDSMPREGEGGKEMAVLKGGWEESAAAAAAEAR